MPALYPSLNSAITCTKLATPSLGPSPGWGSLMQGPVAGPRPRPHMGPSSVQQAIGFPRNVIPVCYCAEHVVQTRHLHACDATAERLPLDPMRMPLQSALCFYVCASHAEGPHPAAKAPLMRSNMRSTAFCGTAARIGAGISRFPDTLSRPVSPCISGDNGACNK